jgi:hypothetical protein
MPDLSALEILVGAWVMHARWPDQPPAEGESRAVFEWMTGGQFLVQRWWVDVPEAPDGLAIIGPNPADDTEFLQHYFDSRGVARVYRMTLTPSTLTLRRDEADFSPLDFRQRYRGTVSADGQSIEGAWEICHDGTTWEHDFELGYRRLR